MKYLCAFTIIFAFHLYTIKAQSPNADSLEQVWLDENKLDILRLQAAHNLFILYFRDNLAAARMLATDMLTFAQRKDNGHWMATSNRLLGNTYGVEGDYQNALEYFKKSLALSEELNDGKNIAVTNNNIGIIYYEQGVYPLALEQLESSLELAQELGNRFAITRALSNIAEVQLSKANNQLALDYLQRSLNIRKEINDKPSYTSKDQLSLWLREFHLIGLV